MQADFSTWSFQKFHYYFGERIEKAMKHCEEDCCPFCPAVRDRSNEKKDKYDTSRDWLAHHLLKCPGQAWTVVQEKLMVLFAKCEKTGMYLGGATYSTELGSKEWKDGFFSSRQNGTCWYWQLADGCCPTGCRHVLKDPEGQKIGTDLIDKLRLMLEDSAQIDRVKIVALLKRGIRSLEDWKV